MVDNEEGDSETGVAMIMGARKSKRPDVTRFDPGRLCDFARVRVCGKNDVLERFPVPVEFVKRLEFLQFHKQL